MKISSSFPIIYHYIIGLFYKQISLESRVEGQDS